MIACLFAIRGVPASESMPSCDSVRLLVRLLAQVVHVKRDVALSDGFGLTPPVPRFLIQYLIVILGTAVAIMRPFIRHIVLYNVSLLELGHDCLEPIGHIGLANRWRVCEDWLGYGIRPVEDC